MSVEIVQYLNLISLMLLTSLHMLCASLLLTDLPLRRTYPHPGQAPLDQGHGTLPRPSQWRLTGNRSISK